MEKEKKSRRRFLADMLFVGGGLTAAAVLAKSELLERLDPTPPAVAGEMVAPQAIDGTPTLCATPQVEVCATPKAEATPQTQTPAPKTWPKKLRDPMQNQVPPGAVVSRVPEKKVPIKQHHPAVIQGAMPARRTPPRLQEPSKGLDPR